MRRHDLINKWWRKLRVGSTYTMPRFKRWCFIYGLLSGIPICCVEWWALRGGRMRPLGTITHRLYKPCPGCRKTRYAVPLYMEDTQRWYWRRKVSKSGMPDKIGFK